MSGTELVKIEGTLRESRGKGANRKMRVAGQIPANILEKGKATAIQLDPKWLSKAWQSGKVFELAFEGATKKVRMHELQIDPIKRVAIHVDLMYV
jgi:ribosomal protein L25 (general stress protein Ctc)